MRRPFEPGQYLSIVYSERLAAEGAVTSIGSRGDSYDNALAESVIGLHKSDSSSTGDPGGPSRRSAESDEVVYDDHHQPR